ncbi:protein yellow-like isoform X2 [Periplaneta americana]|uniref:protein yellow-like isoform X2 n=1 Tax=Periplaneta americana TaxID=6978 RepID=UPI0037E89CAA
MWVQFLVLTIVWSAVRGEVPSEVFEVTYEWNKLDFKWPDDSVKARYLANSQYIPENITISGVKVWRDRLYITLPRLRHGVPATLVSIPLATPGTSRSASPPLEPFPSWEMQEVGNCTALQNVQNVEIHSDGYMWVVDSGRVNILSDEPNNRCPPKLVIFDLSAGTSSTKYDMIHKQGSSQSDYNMQSPSVRVVQFPSSVVSQDSSLVDIVLDIEGDGYTYISDASESDPGLIVYSWKENRSWKVRDIRSMRASKIRTVINGMHIEVMRNIGGLALSPVSHRGERVLYYSSLSNLLLFSIRTSYLRDEELAVGDVSASVKTLGQKESISEGMVMDSRGVLYYGLLQNNAIARWDTNLPFDGNQHKIALDNKFLQWPASFGFDSDRGNLTVITNKFQNFLAERVQLHEANFRIITAHTGSKSYLYQQQENDNFSPIYMPTSTEIWGRNFNDNKDLNGYTEHQYVTDGIGNDASDKNKNINNNTSAAMGLSASIMTFISGFAIVRILTV